MKHRNRPRFLCSGGCGRRVWREHTFCSPRCERHPHQTVIFVNPETGAMTSSYIELTPAYDPATARIPF